MVTERFKQSLKSMDRVHKDFVFPPPFKTRNVSACLLKARKGRKRHMSE